MSAGTEIAEVADDAKANAALQVMRSAGTVDEQARVVELHQLEGGWSRHSYVLTLEDPRQGQRDFIVRVRPPGALLETDLRQEFDTYVLLSGTAVPTPAVHGFEAQEETPFGGPFFVMDCLPGSSPNVWRRRDRVALEDDWNDERRIACDLVDHLVAIHALRGADLGDSIVVRGFQATIDHWQGIQQQMQLVRDPVIEEAYAWAREREPEPVEARLVHGDYRIGNCLVDDGRISGVLDWELSHIGDPRFDLGYISLAYHGGKFVRPGSPLISAVADAEWFYARYTERGGCAVDREAITTFGVLGALMLIAILTTGVRMYADERTTDIRMVWNRFAVPGLRQDLTALMRW